MHNQSIKENTGIKQILQGNEKEILANIKILAEDYFQKTGRKVCRTCPSDIRFMILSLKNIYQMTKFSFKKPLAQYKNKKGDRTTISNSTMTDEKAIEFLKTNPERIKLFAKFPSNWEQLLVDGVKKETAKQKEKRLAIEAEMAAAAAGNEKSATKAELMKMTLKDLRAKYPSVKATSIKEFVGKVLESQKEEKKEEAKAPEAPKQEAEAAEAEAAAGDKGETEEEKAEREAEEAAAEAEAAAEGQ